MRWDESNTHIIILRIHVVGVRRHDDVQELNTRGGGRNVGQGGRCRRRLSFLHNDMSRMLLLLQMPLLKLHLSHHRLFFHARLAPER